MKHHVYVKRQTRICIMWPTFLFTCRLPLIISTPKLMVSRTFFIHKNCFQPFLSAHFLFWEIHNSNLTFAVCRLPFAVYVKLKLPISWLMTIWNLINLKVFRTLQLYGVQFSNCSPAEYNGSVIKTKSNLERGVGNLWTCRSFP